MRFQTECNFTIMEKIIEIHDSTLLKIVREREDVVLHFGPAYVIHSKGMILTDGGEGFVQNLKLLLKDCHVEIADIETPIDLWTGISNVDSEEHDDYIPIPLNIKKEFKVSFSGVTGGVFKATSANAFIIELGKPEFVENIPKA